MNNTIKSVKTKATIIFKDEQSFEIPFLNENSQVEDLTTYGISCNIKEDLYSSSSSNIIGNICSNTLSIEIISKDKLLISSNDNSKYFGLMNNTAKINIEVTGDDDITTNFGTYYINSWENGASNSKYAEVYITAGDLMSRIKNISIGKVRLKEHTTFSSYIISVITALNKKLSDDMQVLYIEDELKALDTIYGTDWQMWYNNIERTDIETIFNTIAQNTLSYIWIDRTGTLRVDCLLDDAQETPVCSISGSTNLFSYQVNNADIYSYDGVNTKFIDNVSYSDEQVLQLSNYDISEGLNTITGSLNTDKVINIHHIEIDSDDGYAKCISFYSFRDYIEMKIESPKDIVANITVYGTIINESYDNYTVANNIDEKGTMLEVENNVMYGKSNIIKYTEFFAKMIDLKNAQVSAEGYINPQVKLSDMLSLKGSKLEISNNYKVVSLDFKLGTNYRCNISLIKTVEKKVVE